GRFLGFKKSDLFLIKQGKQVTRFAHSQNPKPKTQNPKPKTQKPKGKGGASNAPGLSCRAGTPTT
ncbi:hypothetical protein AB0S65_24735, partial [Escherichia coli]